MLDTQVSLAYIVIGFFGSFILVSIFLMLNHFKEHSLTPDRKSKAYLKAMQDFQYGKMKKGVLWFDSLNASLKKERPRNAILEVFLGAGEVAVHQVDYGILKRFSEVEESVGIRVLNDTDTYRGRRITGFNIKKKLETANGIVDSMSS